jgi:hypothetical protein
LKTLHKFLCLARKDREVLIRALFTVAAIRVGLWLLPFRVLRRLLARKTQVPVAVYGVDSIVWAVTTASRYVPVATCLTQALAAQLLLARQGYSAELTIGVAKNREGRLEAHAWLVNQGQVVIGGGEDLSRYKPFPSFDGKTP